MIRREFSAILQDFGFLFVPANSLAKAFSDSKAEGLVIACTKETAYNLLRLGSVFTNQSGLFFFLNLLKYFNVIISIYDVTSSSIPFIENLDLDEDLEVYHLVDEESNTDFYFIPYIFNIEHVHPTHKRSQILQRTSSPGKSF